MAPSSPFERENLEHGIAFLRASGFDPIWDDRIFARARYLAGDDAQRASVLQQAIVDPTVHGVFCARGGYGAARLLAHLETSALRPHCKVFVGFSDVTTLHLFFQQACGWVTFHGPMVGTKWAGKGFDEATARSLIETVTSTSPGAPIHGGERARRLQEGVARGPLVGGNLSLLCHSIGTPYEVDTDGAILLLEDVHEPPYRVDRMLTHLRQAGKLTGVRGVVVGEMLDCKPPSDADYTVDDVVSDCLAALPVPVVSGFPISHGHPNHTVALGVEYELDADARTLTPMEAGTIASAQTAPLPD